LFWLLVLFYPYLKYMRKEGGFPNSLAHELNSLVFHMLAAYAVYYALYQGMTWRKIGLVGSLFVACAYGFEYFDSFFHDENFQHYTWKQIISHILSYATFGLVFFAIFISKTAYTQQRELLTLHEENQVANLTALKAQVTPHFLFNTLNTIYYQAQQKDEKTANLILKLADSTRYFLKEGQKNQVNLSEEMTHLKDYITLQKERWQQKMQIVFVPPSEVEEVQISPLLFIPFIENAFKYTSQLRGDGHLIEIVFTFENGQLTFNCSNPFTLSDASKNWISSHSNGIGIANVKKRLALMYPTNHSLDISTTNGIYNVTLTLTLTL
ncbi:MAG: histidine kinase, partial [Bacteroidota bacterium]